MASVSARNGNGRILTSTAHRATAKAASRGRKPRAKATPRPAAGPRGDGQAAVLTEDERHALAVLRSFKVLGNPGELVRRLAAEPPLELAAAPTPAPAHDDPRAAALALGAALDRLVVLDKQYGRLVQDATPEAVRRFEDERWDPAVKAMGEAERRLHSALKAAGLGAIQVGGRLYAGTGLGIGSDCHEYPQCSFVVALEDVAYEEAGCRGDASDAA